MLSDASVHNEGECVLPRRSSSAMLLVGAIMFYIVTFAILLWLQSTCPGVEYTDAITMLGWGE